MANSHIALVTGAAKGLGLETVKQLAQKGYTVLLGARTLEKATAAAAPLQGAGLAVEPIALEVTDAASVNAAVATVAEKHGRLDVLVNNAGVNFDGEDFSKPVVSEGNEDDLRATFEANFFGLVAVTKAFLPLVRKSGAGRIVNVSSILASLELHATPGSPIYSSKLLAYNVSKTAVNAFTIHLAYELKDTPIKVNSAHPGWVKTDLGGSAAPMEVDEGVQTFVQLATLDESGPTGGFFHNGARLPW